MFYGVMSGGSIGRRRGLALVSIAVCALSLSLAVPGMVSSAGANIANPGNVQISVDLSLVTPTFTLSGVSTKSPASATVLSNGSIFIPRDHLAFGPVAVHIDTPNPAIGDVTVQVVATSNFVGGLNPATHAEWVAGDLAMQWSQTGTMKQCPIGPFRVHVTTRSTGTRPYSDGGTATMVDGNFAIPAVAPGTPGCAGFESSLNTTLSLPISTTTTTTGSSTTTTSTTTTTTTTTMVPTSTTLLTDLVPDTPVPAVVLSTTLTPAPRAPATPPTVTTTTVRTTTTHPPAATTTSPPTSPKKIVPVPKPVLPAKHRAGHAPKKKNTSTLPKRRHKHHKKHHRKHKKLQPLKPAAVRRALPARKVGTTVPATTPATPKRRGFVLGAANRRPPPRPAPHPATPFEPLLVSSRHRASPSGLNYLAMLALLISGLYAWRLLKPDFSEVMRARKRPRRLAGIDPRPVDE